MWIEPATFWTVGQCLNQLCPLRLLLLLRKIPQPAESSSLQYHNLVTENLLVDSTSAYICFSISISHITIKL